MPVPPKRTEVQCASCKQQIDVNRYIVKEPPQGSLGSIHIMRMAGDFVGAVLCPACRHVTIYTPH